MSVELAKQARKRLDSIFWLFVLIAIAIGLGAYAIYDINTQDDDGAPVMVEEPVTSEQAQAILDRANEATDFAGLLLSFVEAASAILGALMVVGAYIFRRSILDEFEKAIQKVNQMEKEATEREQRIKDRESELDRLRDQLTGRIDTLVQSNQATFEDIRGRASNSMRVVSLQLMAEQQVRAHNLNTALKTLNTAHELEPTNPTTNYLLGYLHTSRKEFDQAIGHLEAALSQQETSFTPAMAALGLALRRKGDAISDEARFEERNQLWAQAEKLLLDALALDPSLTDMDGESYYGTLGGLYRRQKRYPDALAAYEKARTVTPASTYPITNLAALNTHQGNPAQARHYFEQVLRNAKLALDDDPRNMWTRMDYAQALLVLDRPDEARAQMRMVLDQGPERVQLETVLNGLRFLAESPLKIEGLEPLIAEMEQALTRMQTSGADKGTNESTATPGTGLDG